MNSKQNKSARELARQYTYDVTYSEDDDIYVATVDEWPGVAAHGPSRETAIEEARQAVSIAIEDCREKQDAYPEPVTS